MKVLIITYSGDNESIVFMENAIRERGGTPIRFNTDRFPTEDKLVLQYAKAGDRLLLVNESGVHNLAEVSAVWYRRIRIAGRLPREMDPQYSHACNLESTRSVMGMITALRAFHLDPIPNLRYAENKQVQLRIARDVGLDTPENLTTNSPRAVREFAAKCPNGIITKMLAAFAVYEGGEELVVYTNPLSDTDLHDLDGLELCPMTFQEKLDKECELRITVAGRKLFAAAVNSAKSDKSLYDWRRDGVGLIDDWEPYKLPQDVANGLLRLMDAVGLNYGAIDVIVTPEGRHVFLEVNPVGEFFWLERNPGLPISGALADVLLNKAPRRDPTLRLPWS